MDTTVLSFVLVVGYLIAVTFIGWRGRRIAQDSDMFNIFGRRAQTIRATAGYMGLIGGGELITITQLGYQNGWHAAWFFGGIALGFIALAFYSLRPKSIADRHGINTLTGFYYDQYGAAAGWASTAIFVVSLGSLLTIQFIVGPDLISSLLGIPHTITIIVMGLVIILYLLAAGLVAVLSTDVLRMIMMSIVLLVVVLYTTFATTTISHVSVAFEPIRFPDNISFAILGFFGALSAPDVWQTIFASKNQRVVRSSLLYGAVAFVAVGSLLAQLGIITHFAIPNLPSESPAFIAAATHVVPGLLASLVAVLVAGSVMATADTEIWVISTLLVSTVKPTARSRDGWSVIGGADDVKLATRIIMPLVTIAAMVAAYMSADAQAIYSGLLSLLTASGPAILGAMFLRSPKWSITLSLWFGLIAYVGISILYRFNVPLQLSLMPFAISASGYVVGYLVPVQARSGKAVDR